ncbi:14631_t:CDS:2, partial [Entrophospora sp. SA101]
HFLPRSFWHKDNKIYRELQELNDNSGIISDDSKKTFLHNNNSDESTSKGSSSDSVGHKIDGIIYTTDELLKLGAIEGARSFKGVSDNKYLDEEFKMPKSLQDMYSGLIRAVNYDDQRADKLQVIGKDGNKSSKYYGSTH